MYTYIQTTQQRYVIMLGKNLETSLADTQLH
jgi:hypothetical protein